MLTYGPARCRAATPQDSRFVAEGSGLCKREPGSGSAIIPRWRAVPAGVGVSQPAAGAGASAFVRGAGARKGYGGPYRLLRDDQS